MPNVKPGDVCIVLGADQTPELNGRVVTVEAIYNGEKILLLHGNLVAHGSSNLKRWTCSSNYDLPVSIINLVTKEAIGVTYSPKRAIPDCLLYKINDQDLDEEFENTNNLDIEEKV